MAVSVKRVYVEPGPEDGTRVLVDRYWPRGLSKGAARVDIWMKELAPSAELIKWFGHKPERWEEFTRRYQEELKGDDRRPKLDELRRRAKAGKVTLLFGARDEQHNNAVALAESL
jgi:uncharacterized protein YeaO (DUF488 family)